MIPPELIKTIYLGDRACKAIYIDGWNKQVILHVDIISRIRSKTGAWDFYTAEDIPDGRLVFGGVLQIRFDPSGPLPNDLINELTASEILGPISTGKPDYKFTLSIGSVDKAGESKEVIVEIDASDLYLQDPRSPANEIRE